MEVLVAIGIIISFIVIGLEKSEKRDNERGYCDL